MNVPSYKATTYEVTFPFCNNQCKLSGTVLALKSQCLYPAKNQCFSSWTAEIWQAFYSLLC